jgi:DNA-binding PadR family transcriptional regulator
VRTVARSARESATGPGGGSAVRSGGARLDELPGLSLSQWAVLGLFLGGPRHGFAVAAEIGPGSSLARVWKVPRPLVYRAIATLERHGLLERAGAEPAPAAPPRVLFRVTDEGDGAFRSWIETPVAHLRDLRSELLVKLWFHDRLSTDPCPLIRAQRVLLAALVGSFERQAAATRGFEAALLDWRLHSARAAVSFLDAQLAGRRGERNGAPAEP